MVHQVGKRILMEIAYIIYEGFFMLLDEISSVSALFGKQCEGIPRSKRDLFAPVGKNRLCGPKRGTKIC